MSQIKKQVIELTNKIPAYINSADAKTVADYLTFVAKARKSVTKANETQLQSLLNELRERHNRKPA